MKHTLEFRAQLRLAIEALGAADLGTAASGLLAALGYRSPKTLDAPIDPRAFASQLSVDPVKLARIDDWRAVHFLFQLTGDELPALSRGADPATAAVFQQGAIDSFVFLAIDIDGDDWARRDLVAITRAMNRAFSMPAILLFRHGLRVTIAVIDRRANRRDASRDVVGGRISLIKDVDLVHPHRAHIEILADLSLAALAARRRIVDFRTLYDAWLDTLSAAELNKRFYGELASWFAWASTCADVVFPRGQGDQEGDKEIALIRLLTRLMFVWFIKEKGLVPSSLFERDALATLLREPPAEHPDGNGYYLAILQNLFFGTLNTEMGKRGWRKDSERGSKDYLGHHVYRHEAQFIDPAIALDAFAKVPFLNGGLFECLDVLVEDRNDERHDLAQMEGRSRVLRIDGFSDQPDKQPRLPNALFFGGAEDVDLSEWFEKRSRPAKVPGLIDLFERYKFTVEENTPLEEEAALDPELLGKVFENLLASYNADTRTTARNKSGSFYTPREVVDFMVDEALIVWLVPKLTRQDDRGLSPAAPALDFGPGAGELGLEPPTGGVVSESKPDRNEARLRALLSYASREHDFTLQEVGTLIGAIESCRAIDPAVGSGAFPLGLLQKLVHILAVLDPGGEMWKARNRAYYLNRFKDAESIPAPLEREAALESAKAELAKFDAAFESGHYPDYTRKLFLIERCLHGVDVQPIAVQIAKLRCFISLAVEQRVDEDRDNRGITPLPNLETKFVAANTLTPLHRKGQAGLVTQDLRAAQRKLREANRAFFAAANSAAKRIARKRITALRDEIAGHVARDGVFSGDDAHKLARWDPFDPNSFAPFFDAEWMFGLEPSANEGWFDIAFANPPYVRHEKIEGFTVRGQPVVAKAQLKKDYATFSGTADLFVYFYERAVRLLKPEGALAFITSNKWYRAGYGKSLRDWLVQQTRILELVNFGDAPVFEAIAYPTILIAARKAVPGRPTQADLVAILNWEPGEDVATFPERFRTQSFRIPQAALTASGWQFEPQAERDLLARIRRGGVPLGEWCDGRFYYGIKTGLNEAFVIDGTRRAELLAADPNSIDVIKPYIGGRDVKRWKVNQGDKWLLFIPWHFPLHDDETINGPSEKAEEEFKRRYPAVYQHLELYRAGLENRAKSEVGVRYEWYALQRYRPTYWREFAKPKIVYPDIYEKQSFAYDETGTFGANTTYFIPTESRWLVGILNSSTIEWFYRQISNSIRGGYLRAFSEMMQQIPIPTLNDGQANALTLVTDALICGAARPGLEALVNAFVYELFFGEELRGKGLSPFAVADAAGLTSLAHLGGPALARAADEWSRHIGDPAHPLYATLFEVQAIEAVRIVEGR